MSARLHLVTDDAVLAAPSFIEVASDVIACCGPDAVLHLRGHATNGARLYALGQALADACLRAGSRLLVNDRVDIAMAVRATGVQLGARSLPVVDARRLLGAGARIGYSAHGAPEAAQAAMDGADFVLAGTIYESATHPATRAGGLPLLRECVERAAVPVVAIGGITPDRLADVAAAGGAGAAVLSGVWHAPDPAAAAAAFVHAARAAWFRQEAVS